MKNVIVHFGLHKTASTLFQDELFRKFPKIEYLKKQRCRIFNRYLIDSIDFDREYALTLFKKIISSLRILDSDDTTILISCERYYGDPINKDMDPIRTIERFRILFNDSLIVIAFFRKQEEMIHSLYLQFVKTGATSTFSEFIYPESNHQCSLNWNYLYYDRFALFIKENFSIDKYKLFTYEDFKRDKESLLLEMVNFLNKENLEVLSFKLSGNLVNKSLDPRFIKVAIFFNRFFKTSFQHRTGLPHSLFKKYMNLLLYFSKSKSRFSSNVPLPLELVGKISRSNQLLDSEFKELDIYKKGYI